MPLLRGLRPLSVVCFLAFAAHSAFAQVSDTGLDQFGTYHRNHIQTMNLFNLNNHIEIPLFAKKERGINFTAKLVWDLSDSVAIVQNPVGSQPGQHLEVYGPGLISVTDVNVTSHLVGSQTCSTNTGAVTTYYDSIVDQNNVVHPFSSGTSVGPTGQYCGSGTWQMKTIDGKWLLNVTWTDQNCWGEGCITSVTETDAAGNVYDGASVRDPNGNQIIHSGSTWTDATGNTVFTAQQSGSTGTFSYPAQGTMVNIQLNSSSFTLANQFGTSSCPMPGYSSTTQNLLTSISLPDGTSYSFTYESANGTYPSTTVTGRIHSITVPAGGTYTYTYSGGT